MRRRPPWWSSGGGTSPSAKEIVAGYLETYDPDWILSLVDDYELPVMAERLAVLDNFGLRTSTTQRAADSLEPVVEHLYETRFRFQERVPPDHAVHTNRLGAPLLGDVLLGCLTDDPRHAGLRKLLASRLGMWETELEPERLVRSQAHQPGVPELVTPLELGSEEFLFRRRSKSWTYVYFCSQNRTWDCIELWNLRAAGLDVFACPIEWMSELSGVISQLLTSADDVLAVVARRMAPGEIEGVAEIAGAHGVPLVAPPVFWGRSPSADERPTRVIVANDIVSVPVVDDVAELPSLNPPWADRRWPPRVGAWINEFNLHDDVRGGELGAVLPHDLSAVESFVPLRGPQQPRLHEGRLIVGFARSGASFSVNVPTGFGVFDAWLQERGLNARPSDPGRTLLEIARKIGGAAQVSWIFGPARLEVVDIGTRRHHLAKQHVERAIRDDGVANVSRSLRELTERGVLRAGLVVTCPRCRQANFVVPQDLAEQMRCERCLEPFAFPHHAPPRDWAYRPTGPFAVPKYAAGAYATLLALRLLIGESDYAETWAPSVEIDGFGELDFVVWREPRFGLIRHGRPELVLGESKSFDRFEERDVERLVTLRTRLGQGWLCFATLREQLADDEQRTLTEAAQVLRVDDDPPPLILLTGPDMWAVNVGRHLKQRLGRIQDVDDEPLWDLSCSALAELTQRLHLRSIGQAP
jgi:hypothetical protein